MEIVFAGILGLIIGSFLNVVILRLPVGQSLTGRSHCPRCGRTLQAKDLLPVVSYVYLKGACRSCKALISIRYPLIELLCGLGFAVAAWQTDFTSAVSVAQFVLYCVVWAISIATFCIDFEHYLILNWVTGIGVALALAVALALDCIVGNSFFSSQSYIARAVLGGVAGALPFLLLWWVSKGKWLGFGDVKFMLFMGAVLGYPVVFLGMLFSFWAGALVAIPLLAFGAKKLGSKIPFGCFLVIGLITALCWGEAVLRWYMGLLQ